MDARLLTILQHLKETVYQAEDRPDCWIKVRDHVDHQAVTITCALHYNPLWFSFIQRASFRSKVRQIFVLLRQRDQKDRLVVGNPHWTERTVTRVTFFHAVYRIKITFSSRSLADHSPPSADQYQVRHPSEFYAGGARVWTTSVYSLGRVRL